VWLAFVALVDNDDGEAVHIHKHRLSMAMNNSPLARPTEVRVMYAVMTRTPHDGETAQIPDGLEPLLRRNGASENLLQMWRERPFAQLIIEKAELVDVAQRHVAARTRAFAAAARDDGVVVDLAMPRLLVAPVGPINLSHADQWVLVHYDDIDSGRIGTRGLAAFGLPELSLQIPDGVAPAMCGAVASGLSYRLLAEWPANDPVGPAVVTLRDIAYGLGDPGADDVPTDRHVRIDISVDADSNELTVAFVDSPTSLFV
jgi:hypothetical protein